VDLLVFLRGVLEKGGGWRGVFVVILWWDAWQTWIKNSPAKRLKNRTGILTLFWGFGEARLKVL
jgi:hypothetical protein